MRLWRLWISNSVSDSYASMRYSKARGLYCIRIYAYPEYRRRGDARELGRLEVHCEQSPDLSDLEEMSHDSLSDAPGETERVCALT